MGKVRASEETAKERYSECYGECREDYCDSHLVLELCWEHSFSPPRMRTIGCVRTYGSTEGVSTMGTRRILEWMQGPNLIYASHLSREAEVCWPAEACVVRTRISPQVCTPSRPCGKLDICWKDGR